MICLGFRYSNLEFETGMSTKREKLIALMKKMEGDDSLPLKSGATRLVFGAGTADSEIVFIGEGPGYWEDQKGLPFVGNAGKLLDQLLASIELERKTVFITNVVHHRPPSNRDPSPEEIAAYQPYLDQIIEILEPKAIVTLGRFSMGKFLPGVTITGVHGKAHTVSWKGRDILVIPMYHPAAALRNGDIKQKLMADFQKIPEEIKKFEEARKPKEEEKKDEQLDLI